MQVAMQFTYGRVRRRMTSNQLIIIAIQRYDKPTN